MKNLLFVYFLILYSSTSIFSQKETYVGLGSVFASKTFYSFIDEGSLIKEANYSHILLESPELFIGRELYNNLYIEFGFKQKNYYIGYHTSQKFKGTKRFRESLFTYQIPVRLKYSYEITNKFIIIPYTGCVLGINKSPYNWLITGIIDENNYSTSPKYKTDLRKRFVLVNLGLELEYSINNRHSFLINIGYSKGFNDLIIQRIDYFTWGEPWIKADVIGQGDYLGLGVSYKYSILANQK